MVEYYEFRQRHPKLPSHYIYTACQMACSIYRSYRKLRRRGRVRRDTPIFRRESILLDDHLFTLDLEKWEVSIATPRGKS